MTASIDLHLPYRPEDYQGISSDFHDHSRRRPPSRSPGIDYPLRAGREILAAAAGTVRRVSRDADAGLYIILDHPGGWLTLYCHLSSIHVAGGDRVALGDLIGRAGTTGRSTGPHLHFALKRDGRWIDPAPYLTANERSSP